MHNAISRLKKLNAKRVFVQYPEGIKLRIQSITKQLEKEGFDIIICTEPCFGACDIRDVEARRLGCDAILHIGHEEFVSSEIPVVYWEFFIEADPLPILEKELHKLNQYESFGLVTSIQFVHTIPKVKKFLEQRGKRAYAYKALQHPGQVLGCNLKAAKAVESSIDCFLCISAGKFYGAGLVMETEKPVLCLDLEKKEIYSLEDFKKKVQKIIAWNKAQLKDAKRVGILVSWKRGQLKQPFELKQKLKTQGKDVYVFAMDEITPEKLEGLKIDAYVNCACPRIGIDDLERYKIPIVNRDQIE